MKYKLADHILLEEWQEGVVVFDVNSYDFLEFNEVGGEIVKGLNKGMSVKEIIKSITDRYEVESSQAREDVLAFCKELADNGIVCKERERES